MKKLVLMIFASFVLSVPAAYTQTLEWIETTEHAPWTEQTAVPLAADQPNASEQSNIIRLDTSATDQRIVGWGGCFNELGWKALLTLPEDKRESVLKALFDRKTGLRFNICRMPIGASDFALDGYSLDDEKDDFNLTHFSIDRDKKLLIPYIKAAMKYRADLKIWASPWSPPGWMKDNGTYHGGHLRMEPKILDAYARYFAKFVQSYRAEGVNVYAVHVQNEPVSDSIYPTCPWKDPEPMRDFIRDYLGPTLLREDVPAQIWLGTMSESRMAWFKVILDDPGAAQYLSGIGLQYEGRKVCKELHDEYPKFPLMETESPCHGGENSWKNAENTFSYMKQFLNGGVEAYMYWNMVLDETGLSSWHWRQNSPVVVDTKTGTVTYTPEFYLMKHFSALVLPGALRLKTDGNWSDALAFKNDDNSIVLVVANTEDAAKPLTVVIGDQSAKVTILAHSFSSFVKR